jgi:hypothetical protein
LLVLGFVSIHEQITDITRGRNVALSRRLAHQCNLIGGEINRYAILEFWLFRWSHAWSSGCLRANFSSRCWALAPSAGRGGIAVGNAIGAAGFIGAA